MSKLRNSTIGIPLVGIILAGFVFCLAGGCNTSRTETEGDGKSKREQTAKVDVVVVDDEPLAKALERQLNSRSNLEVTVRQMSRDEMKSQESRTLKTDLIVYPVDLLGWMIDNEMLISFPENVLKSDEMANNDMLQIQRTVVPKLGSRQYAMSIGSPSLVLLYRQDVLTELKIEAPKTWEEYQSAIELIRERFVEGDSEMKFESATCEPLGGNWAAQMLLARSAAYVSQFGTYSTMFDIETMKPAIDQAPFVTALDELVASAKSSDIDFTKVDPADAEQKILDGKCAMAISWPTKNRRTESENADVGRQVSIAAIPGANRVFQHRSQQWKPRENDTAVSVPLIAATGRVASVSRGSQQSSFAFQLVALIGGREMSSKVCAESDHSAPFRISQLSGVTSWISEDYADSAALEYSKVIEEIEDKNLFMQSLRIPGRDEYLAALSEAVKEAIDGKDSKEALQSAAAEWDAITEKYGVDDQKSAYEKCFGLSYRK